MDIAASKGNIIKGKWFDINKKKPLQMRKNSRKNAKCCLDLTKVTQNLLNNLDD